MVFVVILSIHDFYEILRYHFEQGRSMDGPRTVQGRRSYWIERKQSISCRTWIECRIAGLFGFFILLKFKLVVLLTLLTNAVEHFTYIVILLLSSWPKLSHLSSVWISRSEFVNHLCKQQWNEYSSSSDSDLFKSTSLISIYV